MAYSDKVLDHYENPRNAGSFEKADKINIKFINNKNLFSENEWENLYKLSEETFVEETEELKQKAAGAGLRDND